MSLATARPIAFVITRDRKAAEAFYGGTLGLQRLPGDDFAAVYDLAGTKLRLTEVPGHEPSAHPVLGWEVPDIEAVVDALIESGAADRFHRHRAEQIRNQATEQQADQHHRVGQIELDVRHAVQFQLVADQIETQNATTSRTSTPTAERRWGRIQSAIAGATSIPISARAKVENPVRMAIWRGDSRNSAPNHC